MASGETSGVQINVLGSVGVSTPEGDIELGVRLRRLLAALTVSSGSVVSSDRLVDIVWSGEPPRGADRTLRSYVTRLRKAIGAGRDDLIVHQQPGYVLALRPGELDSERFEQELDDGLQLVRTQDPDAAIRTLTSAIDRWHGPAYSGFAHEDWARPAAVRLEERLIEAREARVDALLAIGRTEQAVADAQSLVETEPLRERSREGLMRALHASGRQAEALRVFTTYRRFLAEETGLDPSDSIVELESRIARNDRSVADGARGVRGYDIGERIGEGAFAVVHRAVQPGLERDVAVKIIRAELADRPDFIRRFEHEARTVARIEHPNVVPLIDFWREPGAAYIVMRLLRGGSVEQALRRSGPYSRDQLLELLADVGGALGSAHQAGVIHRDVRPANLLLDGDGATYLADFGIAIPTAQTDDLPILSPAYAAPEVLRSEPSGVAADVLSLGVTVFELLTGRLPFADTTERVELVRRQMHDALPSVRSTRSDLPGGVDDVISRATAKAPGDRFATVAAFVDAMAAELTPSPARGSGERRLVSTGPIDNPYVGLTAFAEEDAPRFFGRERLVAELIDEVEQRRFVAVVGPSGSGKSSVVRAGLVPAIRQGGVPGSDGWFVTTLLPGRDPFDALETALLRVAVNPPASLRAQLSEPGGVLRSIRRVLPDDTARVLLVVDQFEELFTQVADAEVRDRFLGELADAVTVDRSPLQVVVTLRADHYDAPLRHPALAELVTDGTVTVRPMSPDELGRAITRPADDVGVEVDSALVAELVAGVSARPSALPLLQFSLTELFERRTADAMLLSTHRDLGGLTGALAATADRIVESDGPAHEAEIRRIFGRLVTLGAGKEDTRRRALRSELGSDERTAWVLDHLASARLLSTDRDPATREVTVEIAHEALLRDWPRLRRWIDEDRTDLAVLHTVSVSAAQWHRSDSDAGELARGGRLEAVADLARRHPDWLTRSEREWVDASIAAAEADEAARAETLERERRQNRRLRGLLGAAAVLLVLALGVGGVAMVLRSQAVDSERAAVEARSEAEAQRTAAESAQQAAESARQAADDERVSALESEGVAVAARTEAEAAQAAEALALEDADIERLVAQSAADAVERPDRSMLLALEANRRRDDVTTQGAILRSIATEPRLDRVLGSALDQVTDTTFSRDGSVGISWNGTDGLVHAFDPVSGEPLTNEPVDVGQPIGYMKLSDDGTRAAVTLGFDSAVIDVETLLAGRFEPVVEPIGFVYGLDRVGSVVAAGITDFSDTDREIVSFVEISSGDVLSDLPPRVGQQHVELFDAGDRAAVWRQVAPGSQYAVEIVDTVSGTSIASAQSSGIVTAVFRTPDDRLITGLVDGTVDVWRLTGSELSLDVSIDAHGDAVRSIAGGGTDFLATTSDREVATWEVDGRAADRPFDLPGRVVALSVSSNGMTIAQDGAEALLRFELDGTSVVGDSIESSDFEIYPELDRFVQFIRDDDGKIRSIRLIPFDGGEPSVLDFSDVHPDGMERFVKFSPDQDAVLTIGNSDDDEFDEIDAVTSLSGAFETRTLDMKSVRARLGVEGVVFSHTARVDNGGERIFYGGPIDESQRRWVAAWIGLDGEILAGPLELEVGGSATLLDDGRVVLSGDLFPPAILPADLDGEVVLVEEAATMWVRHRDRESGLLVLAGHDGSAALLDPDTGEVTDLDGATGPIAGAALSPSGDRVALVSASQGLQLFDVASRSLIGEPIVPAGGAVGGGVGARWTDDGSGVWFGPGHGPEWAITDPDRWREIACEIAGRELTAEEWETFVSPDEPQVFACS